MREVQEAGCPMVSGMEGRSVINILKEWEGMCQDVLDLGNECDKLRDALVDALNVIARAIGDDQLWESDAACSSCRHTDKMATERPCCDCKYGHASQWVAA